MKCWIQFSAEELFEKYMKSISFYFKRDECQRNAQCTLETEEKSPSQRQEVVRNFIEMFKDKSVQSSIILLSLLFAGIGLSGFALLSFYASEIFERSGSPISASYASWITAFTKIVVSCGSFYVIHKFNR